MNFPSVKPKHPIHIISIKWPTQSPHLSFICLYRILNNIQCIYSFPFFRCCSFLLHFPILYIFSLFSFSFSLFSSNYYIFYLYNKCNNSYRILIYQRFSALPCCSFVALTPLFVAVLLQKPLFLLHFLC